MVGGVVLAVQSWTVSHQYVFRRYWDASEGVDGFRQSKALSSKVTMSWLKASRSGSSSGWGWLQGKAMVQCQFDAGF